MHKMQEEVEHHKDVEVVICPSFVSIAPLHRQIDHRKFKLGAQNISDEDIGPATGEIGGPMLRGLVKYAIVGHSYRRAHFNDTDKSVGKRVAAALRNDIKPIICIGENAKEKAEGHSMHVISSQLEAALANVTSSDIKSVVICSEPVWAISTSKGAHLPTPEEITRPVAKIREIVSDRFGAKAGREITILYGGSVNSDNAVGYLLLEGVDGFLIGGASLKHKQLSRIIQIARHSKML